jgi:hypothetical protein
MQKCEERGIDIFEAMLELACEMSDKLDRFMMLKEIATYLYPKRKALEVTVNEELAKQAAEFQELEKSAQIKMLEAEVKRLKSE